MPIAIGSKKRARNKKIDKDSERIETSLKRWKITNEAEADARKQGLEDLEFSIGTGQWDAAIKADREITGKPCLTINRAPAFLRQYTGEERQHRPAMLVSPVGSGANLETAEIHQGVLRHIETQSFADVAYDDSYDSMMRIGWGNWRLKTEYISDLPGRDDSAFRQEPRIEKIENSFAVYMSPIRKPDGTDPLWCHVTQDMSKEEFEREYGKDAVTLALESTGNAEPHWVVKDGVRIAEYWWLELDRKVLCLMEDGSTRYQEDVGEDRWIDQREVIARKVCCIKHNAVEVLKEYQWLGYYIPILEVNGVRLNVNGKIYRAGMVRDYRDAQRIYDFMVTRGVEQVDLYGKDPLMVPVGGIKNMEEAYRVMNRKNYPYMYFHAYNQDGKPLPPPSRVNRQTNIDMIQKLIQQADYDMKAVIGIYGPGLGEQGPANETEFAVLNREQASGTGSISWSDNLNRTIRYQAKMLLDLWPKYITSACLQRIINPDDSVKHEVVYNSQHSPAEEGQQIPNEAQELLDGETYKRAYDVGTGIYDVTLSSGPMYRTARQESFKALTAIATAKPELFPMFADVWAKNADWPDAHILAERFKKMLPPQLQDQNADDVQSKLTQAQAMLAALSQQHNIMTAELNRAADTIRTKRLDLETRERIALWSNWTQLMLQRLKSHDTAAQAQMDAQLNSIQHRLETLHESMSIEQEAGQAPETPELPGSVEPKVQPITPAAPVPRPQAIG